MNLLNHPDYRVRENQALGHIAREQQNIAVYEALLAEAGEPILIRVLRDRIRASRAHIAGWTDWIDAQCPRERRAQVRLTTYPRARKEDFQCR